MKQSPLAKFANSNEKDRTVFYIKALMIAEVLQKKVIDKFKAENNKSQF